jgi:hypothetical protein
VTVMKFFFTIYKYAFSSTKKNKLTDFNHGSLLIEIRNQQKKKKMKNNTKVTS